MPLSKAELAENVEFNRYAFKIVKEILAENDKALVANLKLATVNAAKLRQLCMKISNLLLLMEKIYLRKRKNYVDTFPMNLEYL